MNRIIRSIGITLSLWWERLLRALGKGTSNTFSTATNINTEESQELQQLKAMTSRETFQHYTGILGYHQNFYRENGDTEKVEAIEDDLWSMAAAYRDGTIKDFIHDKIKSNTIQYDFRHDDNGDTYMIHKETGERVDIDESKIENTTAETPLIPGGDHRGVTWEADDKRPTEEDIEIFEKATGKKAHRDGQNIKPTIKRKTKGKKRKGAKVIKFPNKSNK